jgi:hypothetical protein
MSSTAYQFLARESELTMLKECDNKIRLSSKRRLRKKPENDKNGIKMSCASLWS